MVDVADLQKWAQGRLSNSVSDDDLEGEDEAPEDLSTEDEGDPLGGERNALWAGEHEGDAREIGIEEADALLDFLKEAEPEVMDAVTELAVAAAGDDAMMVEHGQRELTIVETHDADYPEFTDDQRGQMGQLIVDEIRGAGSPAPETPEWTLAVAVAVAVARSSSSPGVADDSIGDDDMEDDDFDDEIGPGAVEP